MRFTFHLTPSSLLCAYDCCAKVDVFFSLFINWLIGSHVLRARLLVVISDRYGLSKEGAIEHRYYIFDIERIRLNGLITFTGVIANESTIS